MKVLEEGKQVAAFNLLKRIVDTAAFKKAGVSRKRTYAIAEVLDLRLADFPPVPIPSMTAPAHLLQGW